MRALSLAALMLTSSACFAQRLDRVYNRDTGEPFNLKAVSCTTRVMGPIVRQRTVFTFENPYQKLTEASVWFNLDWAAVLSGFAYWFKNEYVPGVLMDKNKAWFIYTAITSRNEDPGIMVQTSPSSYHAQIYPLAIGHDLRVELTTIGFLKPEDRKLLVPRPTVKSDVPYASEIVSYEPEFVRESRDDNGLPAYEVEYPVNSPLDLQLYAQRHRDGRVYVAGLLRRDDPNQAVKLMGLRRVFWTKPEGGDPNARWFVGQRYGRGTVQVRTKDGKASVSENVLANVRGSDVAKLWAHQALVQGDWRSRKAVLDFSLKYGIPSTQTALLAVPQEQMKLFREKAAEWKRQQQEQARRERAWQQNRSQNWRNTRGGDPELRVQLPGAIRAFAILPDGRRIELKSVGDGFWGGSYDIPATAREGEHTIRIVGVRADGSMVEATTTYEVDRTPPDGRATIEGGRLIVRSEPKLARVIAVLADGDEIELLETAPGIYELDLKLRRALKVVLYDSAHNKRELDIEG